MYLVVFTIPVQFVSMSKARKILIFFVKFFENSRTLQKIKLSKVERGPREWSFSVKNLFNLN
jgi:hypothetical protein